MIYIYNRPLKRGLLCSLKSYTYTYDALNRIVSANHSNPNYNLSLVQYDKMGNITRLTRNGHRDVNASSFGLMDDLTYSYLSNQLQAVDDAITASAVTGFRDGAEATTEYFYDGNGNMTRDDNKGITNISYNHLNLPTQVSFANGNIQYIYDASGGKLKKVVTEGSSVTVTDYAGNYIYENGNLQLFSHPEGYIEPNPTGGYFYIYQYKDHLGNIRLSYSDGNNDGSIAQTEIKEENNYYPFGLKHKGYNYIINGTDYPYGFNGMEENDELGLNWLDFGARNYEAALGRWMNIDAMAENYYEWTPYNYTMNNPILFVDPDGNEVKPHFKSKANLDKYNSVIASLKSSSFFSSIYSDLDKDYDVFHVTDFSSDDIARHPTARGKFVNAPISTFFTKDNNYIKLNTSLDESPINQAVVAEEFFHAAQSEFGEDFGGDLSAIEAEAKLGVAFLVYQGMSEEGRGDLNAVAKAFSDFGASDITARTLVYGDRRGFQLNTKITKYFDAVLSGSEITPEMEKNYRAAVRQYSGFLSRIGYSGLLGNGDGSYNGATPILDRYLSNN